LLYFGGLGMLGNQYMLVDPLTGLNNFLTYGSTFGACLVLLAACLGPYLLGWLLIVSAQRVHKGLSVGAALALCLFVLACTLALCVHTWVSLIVPGETFHRGQCFYSSGVGCGGTADPNATNNQPDTLKQFLGGFVFSAFVPLALCAACICASLGLLLVRGEGAGGAGGKPAAMTQEALAEGGNWRSLPWLACLACAVAFASTIFTPVWNFSSTSSFQTPADAGGTSWSLLPPSTVLVFGPPAADPQNWSQPLIYVKLYSDVVIYFTVLLGVAAVGMLGTYSPSLRRILHRRLSVGLPRALAAFDPFPHGACVGELLLAAAMLGLYVWWILYWGYYYTRIATEAQSYGDKNPNVQVAARVFGHLTTLTMSFLCFPVARNSVWEGVFGVPFDRAIKVHRALGSLCWLLVTIHMLVWQVRPPLSPFPFPSPPPPTHTHTPGATHPADSFLTDPTTLFLPLSLISNPIPATGQVAL
jgi:hypothetical protein